jgi:hypothetical protein
MTTSLAALLAGGPEQHRPPRRCKLARTIASLDDTTAAAVLDALHDPAWTDARLSKLIEASGHGHHSTGTLSNHRLGNCCCTDTERIPA